MPQFRILLFWYCTTYLLLEKNKPIYQQLEPPILDQNQPKPEVKPLENEPNEQPEADQQLEAPPLDQGKTERQLESAAVDPLNLFELDGL